MIVTTYYPGDDNRVLKLIQHDVYSGPEGIGLLCAEAERRYATAVRLLSVTTVLWEAVNEHDSKFYRHRRKSRQSPLIRGFDHRVLQSAHDTIAAWFRFCNPGLWLPLFKDDDVVKEANRTAWLTFWDSEVKRLVKNDNITIAVLTAVAYQNEEEGMAAERELADLLRSEYDRMFAIM